MFLAEVLTRKRYIKLEMDEIKEFLSTEKSTGNVSDAINRLFKLEDRFQQYLIAIDASNNSTEIKVGTSKVSVANAIKLRNTSRRKILTLTSLIKNNLNLDVFNLIDQRLKFIEEFILLNNAIRESDWKVKVE
jgi:hypothetical protein